MSAELRALVDAYAYYVDHRAAGAVAALFTEDGVLVVPDVPRALGPTHEARGREAIERMIARVRFVDATLHAVVGHVVDGDTGVVTCIAHHVRAGKDTVWYMRYHDTYVRTGKRSLFARRELFVDWIEERPVVMRRG